MTISSILGHKLNSYEASSEVKLMNVSQINPDSCHVVISGGAVLVPNGDHQTLPGQLRHVHLQLESVFPNRFQSFVHGIGLVVADLEPGLSLTSELYSRF